MATHFVICWTCGWSRQARTREFATERARKHDCHGKPSKVQVVGRDDIKHDPIA